MPLTARMWAKWPRKSLQTRRLRRKRSDAESRREEQMLAWMRTVHSSVGIVCHRIFDFCGADVHFGENRRQWREFQSGHSIRTVVVVL